MNIANKLTLSRVLLTPVFLLLLYLKIPLNFLFALLVFIAASLTDLYDGKLARKRGLVSDFGKFLDPLADKILVMAALTAFIGFSLAHPVAVILITAREFVVSGIRLVAVSGSGKVIAANLWGKLKTTIQMTVIISVMTFYEFSRIISSEKLMDAVIVFSNIAVWITAAFTVVSGVVYFMQNWNIISDGI